MVDCAQPPIDKACGEGIMPDGLAALATLGIHVDDSVASPFRGIRFINGNQNVEAHFPGGVGYGIRRTLLHRWLVDRAAECGVALHWGRRITGLSADGLLVEGSVVASRWLIGADGQNSKLRKLAGLEPAAPPRYRFGFRRHYRVMPWSDFVEVHWSDCGQMYVTPVADDQVCVALITSHKELRFDAALPSFPGLAARLEQAEIMGSTLGAISASRTLRVVHSGSIALVGEAAGSVDAITGEGLAIAFQQAIALADAMRAGDLTPYETSTCENNSHAAPDGSIDVADGQSASAAPAGLPCTLLSSPVPSSACWPCTREVSRQRSSGSAQACRSDGAC